VRQFSGGWSVSSGALALGLALWLAPSTGRAAPREERVQSLGTLMERLSEGETAVVAAERAASKEIAPTQEELARQLVTAQLALREGNDERAAIQCLDLVEHHGESPAGQEAAYYLGVALTRLGMESWAVETFSRVLGSSHPNAVRLHQRAVARLFDLALPRGPEGLAREPGLSALPEHRSRLATVGASVERPPIRGFVSTADGEKLVRWARSFPEDAREGDLRYAFGRYLYLAGKLEDAQVELDALSPLDIPMSAGGVGAQWRVRGAYVAAAASAAMGDFDDALQRFELITRARPKNPRDRHIVELAWMAIARIHHDAGELDDAIAAYRALGRGSLYFREALYESAWALLAAGRDEQAIAALDQLLLADPRSAISIEVKLLRGKAKIRARNYAEAEDEFVALRHGFETTRERLAAALQRKADTTGYFAAVVGDQMELFALDAVLPQEAIPVADSLPTAESAVKLAREAGALERELSEVLDLLARMEDAVASPHKAVLFGDLGAQVAALDHVERELLAVRTQLVFRLAARSKSGYGGAEGQRRALEQQVDAPVPVSGLSRRRIVGALGQTMETLRGVEYGIGVVRAELAGIEHEFAANAAKLPAGAHQAFFGEAEVLRTELATFDRMAVALRRDIERAQNQLRFNDPHRLAGTQARARYLAHITEMYRKGQQSLRDADAHTIWQRVDVLQKRTDGARQQLEAAALARLSPVQRILEEERVNLDAARVELDTRLAEVRQGLGDVVTALYRDIVVELGNLVVRGEVGLLDVAWAMKEAEAGEANRLEKVRDLELQELDRSVTAGVEAAKP